MSPSGGAMTTVEPCMMWSPENSMRSCSSRKQRWFEAWPGRVDGPQAGTRWPRCSRRRRARRRPARPSASVVGEHLGAGALRQRPRPGEWSGWVWVQTIQRMRSPPQPTMASRWLSSSGRGRSPRSRRCRRGRCSCPARSSRPGWGRRCGAPGATGRRARRAAAAWAGAAPPRRWRPRGSGAPCRLPLGPVGVDARRPMPVTTVTWARRASTAGPPPANRARVGGSSSRMPSTSVRNPV